MSTNGSFGFVEGRNSYTLFFNFYNSYPIGLGSSILNFISQSNLNSKWSDYKKDSNLLYTDLNLISKDVSFDNNFIKKSLFCEYAYIINLNDMTLEFYRGNQKVPQIGNRFGHVPDKDGYYPCRLVGVFNISEINDIIDIESILERMNNIVKDNIEDLSVQNHFRKIKLEKIKKSNLKYIK